MSLVWTGPMTTTQVIDCEKSSTLRWARYREAEQILEIDFKNGKTGTVNSTYEYRSFSPSDWVEFQAAESKGKHFAHNIKLARDAQGDPKFPCKRIR